MLPVDSTNDPPAMLALSEGSTPLTHPGAGLLNNLTTYNFAQARFLLKILARHAYAFLPSVTAVLFSIRCILRTSDIAA